LLFYSCRANIVVLMVVCSSLAVLTIVVNSIVLCVLWSYNPLNRHSQNYYKFSLALADLLVGIIVFPTCVSTLYYRLIAQREIILPESLTQGQAVFKPSLSQYYLSAIGFFTSLSLAVSVFSLAIAGFDRLNAIRDPIKYDKLTAANRVKWLLPGIWIFGFVIAILPLFTPGLYPYSLIVGLLVATREEHALYEYMFGFGIPFLAVWISILIIFCTIKKQGKFSRTLSHNSKATVKKERKVYKTLFFMLSAFTLSLAPTIIALFALGDTRILEHQADVYDPDLAASWSSFELFAVLMLMCNSLWNFFIYSYQDTRFRLMANRKYKTLWKSCFSRKNYHLKSPNKDYCHRNQTSVFVMESSRKSSATELESKTEGKSNFRTRIWSVFSNNSDL